MNRDWGTREGKVRNKNLIEKESLFFVECLTRWRSLTQAQTFGVRWRWRQNSRQGIETVDNFILFCLLSFYKRGRVWAIALRSLQCLMCVLYGILILPVRHPLLFRRCWLDKYILNSATCFIPPRSHLMKVGKGRIFSSLLVAELLCGWIYYNSNLFKKRRRSIRKGAIVMSPQETLWYKVWFKKREGGKIFWKE